MVPPVGGEALSLTLSPDANTAEPDMQPREHEMPSGSERTSPSPLLVSVKTKLLSKAFALLRSAADLPQATIARRTQTVDARTVISQ